MAVNLSEVLKLPIDERLKLVESIWESIAEFPEAIELSETHRTELKRRLEAMTYRVRIRPQAKRDVRKAMSWHEKQQSGLGRKFIAQLDAVYEHLADNPCMYADLLNGVRRAIVRRFPYGVY